MKVELDLQVYNDLEFDHNKNLCVVTTVFIGDEKLMTSEYPIKDLALDQIGYNEIMGKLKKEAKMELSEIGHQFNQAGYLLQMTANEYKTFKVKRK